MKVEATATFTIELDTGLKPEIVEKLLREWFEDVRARAERARDQIPAEAMLTCSLDVGQFRFEAGR